MEETDAVSCSICLVADEYGSMVKVPIVVMGIGEPEEKVICVTCGRTIARAIAELQEAIATEAQNDEAEKPDQGD